MPAAWMLVLMLSMRLREQDVLEVFSKVPTSAGASESETQIQPGSKHVSAAKLG